MIKIIKVYKDSRILENGILDTLGLAVRTDNNFDILRFKFDELIDGFGTLLTTLTDEHGELVAFPLTRNDSENSFDLEITKYIVSQPSITFQLEVCDGDIVWHSLQATLSVNDCLKVGEGDMPTTIENWLTNANIVLSEMESATRETENLNIEVGIETPTSIPVTFTDKQGNQTTYNIKGSRGIDGQDATINGVNTLTIEEGQNITIEQVGNVMTISSSGGGGGGTSNYNDLSNKPSINNVTLSGNKSLNDLGIQPSGNYALTSDIPTKVSDLTNDSGYITGYTETDPIYSSSVASTITSSDITNWNNKSTFSGNYDDLTNKPTIPTKVSDLTNDSGFITNSVSNLTNYYTKTEIDSLVGDINTALDTINGEVV